MTVGAIVFIQSFIVSILDAFVMVRSHFVSAHETEGHRFKWFVFSTMLMQGFTTLMIAYDYCLTPKNLTIQCTSYVIIIACMTFCTCCWYEFMVDSVLNTQKRSRLRYFIRRLPVLVVTCLAFLSIWTGWLFKVAEDGTFVQGPAFFLQGFFGLLYVALGIATGIRVLVNSSLGEFRDALRLFCAYIVPCGIAMTIQSLGYKGGFTPVGMSIGMMIMYLDLYISDIKINRQLVEAREELERANAAKSIFLAGMSHEIRTPINAILGMDTMILRHSQEKETLKNARDIQTAGKNLLAIINDILDLSKVESGKMELVEVDYDLASTINDIYNMIETKAGEKGLDFILEIDEKIPSRLYGDDVRLKQVLVNMLTNAVKYTHEGSVSLQVSLKSDGSIHYAVSDTGIGIKEEDINKLSQQFVRVDEKRNRNIEGTGLGISIIVNLLAMMGTEVKIDSVYGQGSTFSFDLYQKPMSNIPIGDIARRLEHARSQDEDYQAGFAIPDARLLVVDDNDMNRTVFMKLLEDLECSIDEASSGASCLELVRENQYDIIFMDHMMPEMDGLETYERMKLMGDYINAKTPVVILTANAVSGAREEYLALGFSDYLAKPIEPAKLETMVGELVSSEKKTSPTNKSSHVRNSVSRTDERIMNLPMIDGVEWSLAYKNLGSYDLLMKLVDNHILTAESELAKLESMYRNLPDVDSYQEFRIHVHSMKSNAASFGAVHVAGLAKYLEYAARDEDFETIKSLYPSFAREWISLKEVLIREFRNTEIDESEGEEDKGAIPRDLLISYFDELSSAVQVTDIDLSDEIIDKIGSYSYSGDEAILLDKLKIGVMNLNPNECNEVINSWKELL